MPWFIVLMIGLGMVSVLAQTASNEWGKPVTWREAISKTFRGASGTLIVGTGVTVGVLFFITHLLTGLEAAHADIAEFETGMTQALERVAYLRGGTEGEFREWSGHASDGSRYALLRDERGAVVRVENLSRASCQRVVGLLSPYASASLAMRDERGVLPLGDKAPVCPERGSRLQAVFRAPA